MDTAKLRLLLDQRDDIDSQIAEAVGAAPTDTSSPTTRKPKTCSVCGESGHNAARCPKKPTEISNEANVSDAHL